MKIISPIDPKLKVASVVLTVCHGQSYDPSFTRHSQKSLPGTQTVVASVTEKQLMEILTVFGNSPSLEKLHSSN